MTGIGISAAHGARASDVLVNSKRAGRVHRKNVNCTSTSGADVMPRVYPENRMHVACAQSTTIFATCAICHEQKKYIHKPFPLSFSTCVDLFTAWTRSANRGDLLKTAGNAYRLLRIVSGMWQWNGRTANDTYTIPIMLYYYIIICIRLLHKFVLRKSTCANVHLLQNQFLKAICT